MIIKRIKYSAVFIVMFFSCVNLASAGLEITEVMYDPPQEQNENYSEWIEIYNPSGEIDLKNLLVCNNQVSSGYIRHIDNSLNKENNLMLGSGKFAIITDGGSGTDVYDNFSISDDVLALHVNASSICGGLSNTGETITLSGLSFNPYSVSYDSSMKANGDGNSLQLISGMLKPATPTPGTAYYSSDSSSDNSLDNNSDTSSSTNDDNNSSTSTSSTSSTPKEIPVIYKIATKIIAPKVVTAGVPFNIDHTTTGLNKEKIILGKFVWNFGDGRQKQLSISDPFSYVYDYPSEYVLTLSYFDSIFDINPDATDRLTIKVIPSGVNISSVGTYADPFVEIENNSSYEMSLNKWIMKGSVHSFLIPEGMVILSNKKLKFSPKITGFDFNDLSFISIIDQSGQVFATYPKQKAYSTKNYSDNNSQGNIVKADIVTSDQVAGIANSPDVINLNDLGASAENSNNGLNNKILIYLGLAGIIAIGLLSIFLIRRKNEIPDYVEKGVSASDMTIIE